MNLSAPFIDRPVATTLLTFGDRSGGRDCLPPPAGVAAAAGRLPDDFGAGVVAGRQPRNDGGYRGDAARALARAHRRHHRDDVVEFARLDAHYAAVRPEPRHRRRRARRTGGDQCCAQSAAVRIAQQPDLPQGESRRRADHDPGAHLRHDDAGTDVRCRVDDHRAEAVAGDAASGRSASAAARCPPCGSN